MHNNLFFQAPEAFLISLSLILFFNKRRINKGQALSSGISLAGGLAIGCSFIIVSLWFFRADNAGSIPGLLVASGAMLLFGFIDDLKELSVFLKFTCQFLAVCVLVFFGIKARIVNISGPLNMAVTFIWLIGITNAFNHLDVIDGLAGITGLICALSFALISLLNADTGNLVLCLILAGSICGFLVFNLPPAKLYMGNTGSHFLGFVLSAVALSISYATLESQSALFTPLFIMGLPIFDTTFLTFVRIYQGKIPFQKSNDHLALRFQNKGMSKQKALLYMSLLSLFFSASGIVLYRFGNVFTLGVISVLSVIIIALVCVLSRPKNNG